VNKADCSVRRWQQN